MRYSIITPSRLRPSLWRLCESIDKQTNGDWEHLVAVNDAACPENTDKRKFLSCDFIPYTVVSEEKWGRANAGRWMMWEKAQGDYLLYFDDDNYLADDKVLETLECVTMAWATFPILFEGGISVSGIDTNNIMHRKECGCWPSTDSRSADQDFVSTCLSKFPRQIVDSRPLVIYDKKSWGC